MVHVNLSVYDDRRGHPVTYESDWSAVHGEVRVDKDAVADWVWQIAWHGHGAPQIGPINAVNVLGWLRNAGDSAYRIRQTYNLAAAPNGSVMLGAHTVGAWYNAIEYSRWDVKGAVIAAF